MITLFRANETYSPTQLKNCMREHIQALPQKISFVGTPTQILRFELLCEPIDILTWLHNNQTSLDKMYFCDREKTFEMGGIGIADCIEGKGSFNHADIFEYMELRLSADNPDLRYYGGINFFMDSPDEEWRPFGTYRFLIPQFELVNKNGQATFAFNICIQNADDKSIEKIIEQLEQIDFQSVTSYRKTPVVLSRHDYPDKDQWQNIFEKVAGKFEKIVLARKTTFDFDMDIRPMALIKHLKDMAPNCFHFCFQPNTHYGFLGATPERLFKREGNIIQTEALAGTAKRGKSQDEDDILAKRLLESTKNTHEHQFVVQDLKNKLSSICSDIKQDSAMSLFKLDNGQHLITRFKGELLSNISDDAILNLLHPTPAVGGVPGKESMEAINQLEPFHRGWYAGPVGYVGYNEAEFAVAIRSGLVHQNQLSLYAGAGIVEGSVAEEEWEEIESKMGNFIKVFNR